MTFPVQVLREAQQSDLFFYPGLVWNRERSKSRNNLESFDSASLIPRFHSLIVNGRDTSSLSCHRSTNKKSQVTDLGLSFAP